MYYVYMLRCNDNSIYTGITTDIERRMKEHFERGEKCAKYTYNHIASKLLCAFKTEKRSDASKLEYYIKRLKRVEKEKIIKEGNLEEYLNEKISISLYKFVSYI